MRHFSRRFCILGIALFGLATACHQGLPAGSGSRCGPALPCRAFFTCITGHCQPTAILDVDASRFGGAATDAASNDDASDSRDPTDIDRPDGEGVASDSRDAPEVGGAIPSDSSTDVLDAIVDDASTGRDARGSDADSSSGLTEEKCALSSPFGPAAEVGGLNLATANDSGARFSADELTVLFNSDRSGSDDIFTAFRVDRTSPFSTPMPLTAVNSTTWESSPSSTADGLVLFFERNTSIYVATRSLESATFSPPSLIVGVIFPPYDGQPFVLPNGSALFFVSGAAGSNDLFRATRSPNGIFTDVRMVSGINTPDTQEYFAVPSPDELIIYFASNRSGQLNGSSFDIWVSSRQSASEDFGPPSNIAELNTSEDEWPSWVSADGCRLYFSRSGALGRKIYVAERPANGVSRAPEP